MLHVAEKGMLSCCKYLFEYIEANLAHIQMKMTKKINMFLAKSSRSQWVNQVTKFFLKNESLCDKFAISIQSKLKTPRNYATLDNFSTNFKIMQF